MEKWMCLGSLGVAAILALIFLLDLFMGWPFSSSTPPDQSSPFTSVDVLGLLACIIVGYMGFNAYRDVR